MEKLQFKANGKSVPIYVDQESGMVFTNQKCCINRVRRALSNLMYNPKITPDNRGIYLAIPNPSIELTPEGEKVANQVKNKVNKGKIKTNPVPLSIMILGSLLGVSVLCSKMPDLSMCKALGDAFWEVFFPITSFAFAGMLGIKLGESLAY